MVPQSSDQHHDDGHLVAVGAGEMLGVPRVAKGGDHLTHNRFAAKVVMTMVTSTMIMTIMSTTMPI